MGKITDKTKLVPASPGRIDITAPFVSTDLSTGETTLFWLYETRIINGETEEAEIVATQTFGDWHALRKFGTALIDSIEERKPTT